MLTIPVRKKPVQLQLQLPKYLKQRLELLIKQHKAEGISLGMDMLVEYLLGRMLDEAPELADFRARERSDLLTPDAKQASTPSRAPAPRSAAGDEPAVPAPKPPSPVMPESSTSELVQKEMARRANATMTQPNTQADSKAE